MLRWRTSGAMWLAAPLLVAIIAAGQAQAQEPRPVVLANAYLRLELDSRTGVVRRLDDLARHVSLLPGADGAEAFRLALRAPGGAHTAVVGTGLAVTSWTRAGDRVTAEWSGPLRDDRGGKQDIAVRATFALVGRELRIWTSVTNRSRNTILEVAYPTIGGLDALAGTDGRLAVIGSNPAVAASLTAAPGGDLSAHYPGMLPMAFVDIGGGSGRPGLYFGAHDTVARLKVFRVGHVGTDRAARLVHTPFLPPGARMSGAAAVYRFHGGALAGAGRIYRDWFLRTFGLADPRQDWIRQQSFFLMTMFMLPEGNINYRFRDIPRWAAEARKYGVTSVQVSGWQRGGHDNGYPYYEPDPRLGTWEDLRRAIRACHRMGMKVYFFANLQPAMVDLEWYRRELSRYAAVTERGSPLWVAGWGMGTLASRMALTTPQMAFLDPAFGSYGDALMRYFRKLASVGADGVHIDKMFPAAIDANPRAPMGADTATWEGAIRFLERLCRECRAINPSWRISDECNWDRVLQFGTATWWAGNMTAVKAFFPETLETVGLYQPYDFIGVNNAVRSGHAVMVAPFCFQRSMDVRPWRGLSAYIRDVKRVRDRLSDIVFLGEPLGPVQARFSQPLRDGSLAYNTFRSLRTGRRACVLTNNGGEARSATFAGFDGSAAQAVRLHTPGRLPVDLALPATVNVPAERLVILEDLSAGVVGRPSGRAAPRPRAAGAAPFANADFEAGDLRSWKADPNWTVDDNSAGGWYSGWQGRWYAWSGKGGEARTGRLRSPVFTLRGTGVQIGIAGWADIRGRTADRWNYVTLNLVDGRELDRAYAPNTTAFTPVVLDGSRYRGQKVYLEAVDDATDDTFSMLCIDDVRVVDAPAAAPRPAPVPRGTIVLEDRLYRVEVARGNGAIVRLRDKGAGEELIAEPRLADCFRLSLPIRGREAWQNAEGNYLQGRAQRLTSWRRLPAGLELHWAGPLRAESGAAYPVSVTMRIVLAAGSVRFTLHVDNRSRLELGEVYYPILGGLTGLGRTVAERRATTLLLPVGASLQSSQPFRAFNSMSWLGVFGPEQFYAYPATLSMPWMALRAQRGGRMLYLGAHDSVARLKVAHLEMLPGVAGLRSDGNWPRADELRGLPVGVKLCWVHIAYQPPGRPFDASPVVLRCLRGDWRDAARTYGAWFASVRRPAPGPTSPAWRVVASPRWPDLPAQAREAAAAGVHALLVTGWEQTDADGGVRLCEPRGGWDEMRAAIAACRQVGVEVYLQVRLNPVLPGTRAYGEWQAPFTCVDRWGVAQTELGADPGGPPHTQAEAFVSGARRVWLNPGHPGLRAQLVRRLARLAESGAAGVQLTGFFGQPLDFNATLGGTPDRASWEGALRTLDEASAACRARRPGFALVLDEPRDRLVAGPTTVRADVPDASPLREAFPHWRN